MDVFMQPVQLVDLAFCSPLNIFTLGFRTGEKQNVI